MAKKIHTDGNSGETGPMFDARNESIESLEVSTFLARWEPGTPAHPNYLRHSVRIATISGSFSKYLEEEEVMPEESKQGSLDLEFMPEDVDEPKPSTGDNIARDRLDKIRRRVDSSYMELTDGLRTAFYEYMVTAPLLNKLQTMPFGAAKQKLTGLLAGDSTEGTTISEILSRNYAAYVEAGIVEKNNQLRQEEYDNLPPNLKQEAKRPKRQFLVNNDVQRQTITTTLDHWHESIRKIAETKDDVAMTKLFEFFEWTVYCSIEAARNLRDRTEGNPRTLSDCWNDFADWAEAQSVQPWPAVGKIEVQPIIKETAKIASKVVGYNIEVQPTDSADSGSPVADILFRLGKLTKLPVEYGKTAEQLWQEERQRVAARVLAKKVDDLMDKENWRPER